MIDTRALGRDAPGGEDGHALVRAGGSTEAGAATRAELLASGRKLFAQRGFDGTSIRAITRDAGANLGAVTYHFGSKRELYSAVLEQGLSSVAARVRTAAAMEGSGLERMLGVVRAYFEHLQDHPDLPRLLLQEVAAGKEPPPVVLRIILGVKQTIVELHAQGIADGSVRASHPVLTALSVISQPIYLALVSPLLRTVGPVDLGDPRTREMTLEHISTFVRGGLSPRGETGG